MSSNNNINEKIRSRLFALNVTYDLYIAKHHKDSLLDRVGRDNIVMMCAAKDQEASIICRIVEVLNNDTVCNVTKKDFHALVTKEVVSKLTVVGKELNICKSTLDNDKTIEAYVESLMKTRDSLKVVVQQMNQAFDILAETQSKLAETESTLDNTESKLVDAQIKLADTETKLADAQSELADTESKLVDTESKLVDAQIKLADTETKLADTESKLADRESKESKEERRKREASNLRAVSGLPFSKNGMLPPSQRCKHVYVKSVRMEDNDDTLTKAPKKAEVTSSEEPKKVEREGTWTEAPKKDEDTPPNTPTYTPASVTGYAPQEPNSWWPTAAFASLLHSSSDMHIIRVRSDATYRNEFKMGMQDVAANILPSKPYSNVAYDHGYNLMYNIRAVYGSASPIELLFEIASSP